MLLSAELAAGLTALLAGLVTGLITALAAHLPGIQILPPAVTRFLPDSAARALTGRQRR